MDKYEKREGGTGAVRRVGGGRGGGRMEGGRESGGRQRKTTHTHTQEEGGERLGEREGSEREKRERGRDFFRTLHTAWERGKQKQNTTFNNKSQEKHKSTPKTERAKQHREWADSHPSPTDLDGKGTLATSGTMVAVRILVALDTVWATTLPHTPIMAIWKQEES